MVPNNFGPIVVWLSTPYQQCDKRKFLDSISLFFNTFPKWIIFFFVINFFHFFYRLTNFLYFFNSAIEEDIFFQMWLISRVISFQLQIHVNKSDTTLRYTIIWHSVSLQLKYYEPKNLFLIRKSTYFFYSQLDPFTYMVFVFLNI